MIVVLDNIRSAYNVGAILRTCDAFGIKKVYSCGITADIDDKKVLKTSLGAEKGVKHLYFNTTEEAIEKLKKDKYLIFGLEIDANAKDITGVATTSKTALILGNEVSGLAPNIMKECDELVQIPMHGLKESLNVSVAAGIAIYELSKN